MVDTCDLARHSTHIQSLLRCDASEVLSVFFSEILFAVDHKKSQSESLEHIFCDKSR